MPKLRCCSKGVNVQCGRGHLHVILSLAWGLAEACMQVLDVRCLVGRAIHESFVFICGFVGVPFCVGCEEGFFIHMFADIRGAELGFRGKCDWDLILSHPLIVCESKLIDGLRGREHTRSWSISRM